MALTPEQQQAIAERMMEVMKRASTTQPIQPIPQRQGFFKETIGDIKDTFSNIKQNFTRAGEKIDESARATRAGEQSFGEGVFQTFGAGVGALSGAVGDTVIGAGKVVLPQGGEDFISDTTQRVVEPIVSSDLVQGGIERFENLSERAQRNLGATGSIVEAGLDVLGAKAGTTAVRAGRDALRDTAGKVIAETGETLQSAGQKVPSIISDITGKSIGMSDDTVATIFTNPAKFKEAQKAGFDRVALGNLFNEKIKKSLKELSETGKAYDPIRNSDSAVVLSDNFIENQIRNLRFDIVDGKIKSTTKSPTTQKSDIKGLQDLYNNWSKKDILDADEFLNLRRDLSGLSKFDRQIGKSSALENIAKSIRAELNQFSDQIPNLKELDKAYSNLKNELDPIKRELFDKDGNFKDTAINRIFNAANQGNSERLKRYQKVIPDIAERIKILQALREVETSGGIKIGTYFQSGLGLGTLLTGSLPLMIAFMATSSPRFVTGVIAKLGEIYPKVSKTASSVVNKMQKGIKLNAKESRFMQAVINSSDKFSRNIIEKTGASLGIGAVNVLDANNEDTD
jgi:hypothetical protein